MLDDKNVACDDTDVDEDNDDGCYNDDSDNDNSDDVIMLIVMR